MRQHVQDDRELIRPEYAEQPAPTRLNNAEQERLQLYAEASLTELLDYLDRSLTATDVLVEGMQAASATSELGGILLASLGTMRDAVTAAIVWLQAHGPQCTVEDAPAFDAGEFAGDAP